MPLCNMEEKMPLVSVAVITYNSSKYVLETLESIKAQTYKNIELIISDDCSTDNTMQLCKDWCDQNKDRFVRMQYVEVEQNTGVSANCNRAEDACEAEWVKLIAGDDLLLPNCITDFMDYVFDNPDTIYVFGQVKVFGQSKDLCNKFENDIFDRDFWNLTNDAKLKELIYGRNHIPAAACFYNHRKKNDLGLRFDERIPMLEDWPMWINLIKAGVDMKVFDKNVVMYRVHEDSLSVGVFTSSYYRSKLLFYFYYIYDEKTVSERNSEIQNMIDYIMNYYNTYYDKYKLVVDSRAYKLGRFLLSPIYWIRNMFNCNKR